LRERPRRRDANARVSAGEFLAAGPALVSFTVLYNAGGENDAKAALGSIQGLRITPKSVSRS
jgi:hypothetical protein